MRYLSYLESFTKLKINKDIRHHSNISKALRGIPQSCWEMVLNYQMINSMRS